MPVHIIQIVSDYIFGEEVSHHLLNVLVKERSFKVTIQKETKSVKYGAGQPMGLNSSWAIFTVTHHCILRYCEYVNGVAQGTTYFVLGDDTIIFNEKVANTYQKFIKEVGVEISLKKSYIPEKNSPFCGEFAKRLFTHEGEISPLPYRLFSQIKSKIIRDGLIIASYIDRGTNLESIVSNIPDSIKKESILIAGVLTELSVGSDNRNQREPAQSSFVANKEALKGTGVTLAHLRSIFKSIIDEENVNKNSFFQGDTSLVKYILKKYLKHYRVPASKRRHLLNTLDSETIHVLAHTDIIYCMLSETKKLDLIHDLVGNVHSFGGNFINSIHDFCELVRELPICPKELGLIDQRYTDQEIFCSKLIEGLRKINSVPSREQSITYLKYTLNNSKVSKPNRDIVLYLGLTKNKV